MFEVSLHQPGTWRDSAGREVSHQDLLGRMARKRVVLLGETHDRFDVHRWQLHVSAGLLAQRGKVAMGFEMFPRRLQPVLDAWLVSDWTAETFLAKVEWDQVWRFDPALYLPLFNFCRQMQVPMLALNCHRPLVTRVGKEGWDAILEAERDSLTPAQPATAAYRDYLFNITGGTRSERAAASGADPAFDRFVRAQQTWDRAFACNIDRYLQAEPDALVIGIIGRGHLEFGHGTPFQLDDLGVREVAVLLPSDSGEIAPGMADAVFRLAGPAERPAS